MKLLKIIGFLTVSLMALFTAILTASESINYFTKEEGYFNSNAGLNISINHVENDTYNLYMNIFNDHTQPWSNTTYVILVKYNNTVLADYRKGGMWNNVPPDIIVDEDLEITAGDKIYIYFKMIFSGTDYYRLDDYYMLEMPSLLEQKITSDINNKDYYSDETLGFHTLNITNPNDVEASYELKVSENDILVETLEGTLNAFETITLEREYQKPVKVTYELKTLNYIAEDDTITLVERVEHLTVGEHIGSWLDDVGLSSLFITVVTIIALTVLLGILKTPMIAIIMVDALIFMLAILLGFIPLYMVVIVTIGLAGLVFISMKGGS